jgi:hypothetical protein
MSGKWMNACVGSPLRAIHESRPGTAATVRPNTVAPIASEARPHSAPAKRPKSGRKKGVEDMAVHCARLRTMASQPKASSTDRESLIAVVEAMDQITAQKQEALESARAAAEKIGALVIENAELREQLQGLEDLVAEYKKLDVVAEMMEQDQLADSITEINATIHRYNPTAQKPSVKLAVQGHDDDNNSSLSGSVPGVGSGMRPNSPTVFAQLNRSTSGDSALRDAEAVNDGLHTHALLQDKLRALEQLVFVLKKRVLVLESNQELIDMMGKFGSVQDMLDKMTQLQADNDKLRLRELEFARDPLIRRRVCSPNNSTVTAALLLALQNELAAAYTVMECHNMELANGSPGGADAAGREGGVLGGGADATTHTHTGEKLRVEDLLEEGQMDERRLDAVAPRGDERENLELLHPKSEHELMQRLNAIEFGNAVLRDKIRRMEDQQQLKEGCALAMEDVRRIEEEYVRGGERVLGGEEMRLVVKEKKVARLQRYNDALLAKVGLWERDVSDRDETIATLNDVVAHMTAQKRQMSSDIASLAIKCAAYKESLRKCQATLNRQNLRMQALYQMAQVLALASVKREDLPEECHAHFVGYIYCDVLRAHVTLIRASTRLQKAFRGHAGRRAYLERSRGHGIHSLPLPWHVAVRGRGSWDRKGSKQSRSHSHALVAKGGTRGGPDDAGLVLGFVEPLCRVLVSLPEGVRVCAASAQLCSVAGVCVCARARVYVCVRVRVCVCVCAGTVQVP